ncbi:MAG: ROK family protein, partial [Desulfococcaceae bacterium]|nr:ROK family protein [Desulfococcaceae bacterium]
MISGNTYRIGIDVGGTKTEAVLLDTEDRLLFRKRIPTPGQEGYESILHSVYGLIRETCRIIPENAGYT